MNRLILKYSIFSRLCCTVERNFEYHTKMLQVLQAQLHNIEWTTYVKYGEKKMSTQQRNRRNIRWEMYKKNPVRCCSWFNISLVGASVFFLSTQPISHKAKLIVTQYLNKYAYVWFNRDWLNNYQIITINKINFVTV